MFLTTIVSYGVCSVHLRMSIILPVENKSKITSERCSVLTLDHWGFQEPFKRKQLCIVMTTFSALLNMAH